MGVKIGIWKFVIARICVIARNEAIFLFSDAIFPPVILSVVEGSVRLYTNRWFDCAHHDMGKDCFVVPPRNDGEVRRSNDLRSSRQNAYLNRSNKALVFLIPSSSEILSPSNSIPTQPLNPDFFTISIILL